MLHLWVELSIHKLFKKNIKEKNITFLNGIKEETKALADLNHFNLIFRNLISNAIKFTPEGGIIQIDTIKVDNKIKIVLKDNGVGMSEEILDKIFDNSEHYTTYGTNNERGTGIGLLLCKEMIAKNNGSIHVNSINGKGSEFTVDLPLFNED